MNEAFFTTLTTRLTELTADLRYLHKPTGEQRAPQVIGTMLPRPSGQVEEGDEYPLIRWVLYEGEFARMSPAPFSLLIDGVIYNDGSISDGTADITELCRALGRIVEKPWYRPYKLRNRVRFTIGDPDENNPGIQPHPYYYLRMYLEFVVASGHGG